MEEPEDWGAVIVGGVITLALLLALGLGVWPGWPAIGAWVAKNFDGKLALNLAVPAGLVVIGWLVAHKLSFIREIAAKRRETRIKVLETAFMALHAVIGRKATAEQQRAVETAVGQIQLYGTIEQLELVSSFVLQIMKPGVFVEMAPLLVDLQNSIRSELGLPPSEAKSVSWLMLYPNNPQFRKVKLPVRSG